MRKLLTLENIPATKSEVTKEVFKVIGKSMLWTLGGYCVIFGGLVAVGLAEKKKLEKAPKEEN